MYLLNWFISYWINLTYNFRTKKINGKTRHEHNVIRCVAIRAHGEKFDQQ